MFLSVDFLVYCVVVPFSLFVRLFDWLGVRTGGVEEEGRGKGGRDVGGIGGEDEDGCVDCWGGL